MSKSFYLLTAFGKDRPGIVAEVTREVFARQGNIEDATMTRLGGEFTMMLVVSLPKNATFKNKPGLTLTFKPVSTQLAQARHRTQATHLISVYGIDRPGIVYRVADALAQHHLNITDLNTKTLQRSGQSLYVMLLEVQIPSRLKATALKKQLQRLGRSLHLDVTLQDIDPVSL